MKSKTSALLFFLFVLSISTSWASGNDTIWTSYSGKAFKISVLGGDLHYLTKSKVKIEAIDPNLKFTVKYDKGIIEKIDKNWYYITPNTLGRSTIKVNNQDFLIFIYPIQEPRVYLDGKKNSWEGIISQDELRNTTKIIIKNKHSHFDIDRYTVSMIKNGDLVSITSRDSVFNKEILKLLANGVDGSKFWIEDILVKDPDGNIRCVDAQKYKVTVSYPIEFIRRTVGYLPYTYDLNLMKTDLRIKLMGHPGKEDIKTVTDLAAEMNGVLETIKVKIVDNRPNLIIVFDSIKNDSTYNWCDNIDCGYKYEHNNLFFPFLKKTVMYVNPRIDSAYRAQYLRKDIVELFGVFNNTSEIGKDSSVLNYSGRLSSYDKYMLKTLYSYGGEEKVRLYLDKKFDYPDKNGVYILMLFISICLLFTFSEIYHYYGIDNFIGKVKYKLLKRIIESTLIAQIPAIAFLFLLIEKFVGGDFHEAGFCLYLDMFFVPFAILTGVLFLALDIILGKIKKNWIAVILNFFVSLFCIWVAYQIIYLFFAPSMVPLESVGWKILGIPLLITLYRLYARFQTNKITSLLQEKELELAKQKELKFKSDLNALQARINPHFLYNALNSLASLAHIDASKTEQMALSLSKLFRYNINKDSDHYATIRDEVEMTGIYLEIEKNRFDDKMDYSIEVENPLNDFVVPRFILQPLAENAVKHGISKITTGGIIRISIFEKDGKVMIEIYDNGPDFPGGLISGYGLQNTYEKLKLLYKKPFEIEFINTPEKKLVIMLSK